MFWSRCCFLSWRVCVWFRVFLRRGVTQLVCLKQGQTGTLVWITPSILRGRKAYILTKYTPGVCLFRSWGESLWAWSLAEVVWFSVPVAMRRAIVATALSLLSSAGAFQVRPGLHGSGWVRPVPTAASSAVLSRPGEAQFMVVDRMWRLLLLCSLVYIFCLQSKILGLFFDKRTCFFS